MRRFLEYEKASGRIACEVYAEHEPEVSPDNGVLEIDENMTLDTNNCTIRDGVIVRLHETQEEINERERLRKEYKEHALARIKGLAFDFTIAQIEEDDGKMAELRAEYAELMKRVI